MRPKPYKPRIDPPGPVHGRPVVDPARPWLALRADETEHERQARLSKTCWRCGEYIEDSALLDEHEAGHESGGGRDAAK